MTSMFSMRRFAPTLLLASLMAAPTWAAPGAHGPNGEHLDGPAAHSHAPSSNAPRFESHTEQFELVATLADGELSILIDRFATNEPVLGAQVEVESDGRKAVAKFHADHGDYAVADEAFLQGLAKPGEHAVVITVTAGQDTDLLDGVLRVGNETAEAHGHDHAPASRIAAWIGGLLVLAAAAFGVLTLRRRRQARIGGAA
jgi:hypothetical protein